MRKTESTGQPHKSKLWGRVAFWAPCLLVAAAVAAYALPPRLGYARYQPQAGDVVFQSLPHNPLVNAIEGCSGSPYSHCGLVAWEDGGWYVYEAYHQVERTPLRTWCSRGRGQAFDAYRLDDDNQQYVPAMLKYAQSMLGRPYDLRYQPGDDQLYCSELVYRGYEEATRQPLGQMVRLGDLNWRPYEAFIKQLENGPVPVDRQMITPANLAAAKPLKLTYRYGYDAKAKSSP